MAEWVLTAVISLVSLGLGAWLNHTFAMKKQRRDEESKARETRKQGAIRVHQDVQSTLRDLNELPGYTSLSTPDRYGKALKRFDERLDLFKTEGRLYFPEQLGGRIHRALGDCRVAAQSFSSPHSGYANAVRKMMAVDTDIKEYIDTLRDKP